jgi:1-acyl-sn-glycerol-3-phosphate acyltransferase
VYFAVKFMGYRIKELKRVRKEVGDLFKKNRGSWVICPNHLTMIDSVILAYAMVPFYRYMFRYRLLPWNLPERSNFQSNIFLAAICYLTKCIPIDRGGDRGKVKSSMDRCAHLLKKGESLLIFPEGGRSRTGRINEENFSYGVGRLITNAPDCHVMCVYLRGDKQKTYSNIPGLGESFVMKVEAFEPRIENKGLKAQRSCAAQIVENLARMERDYFDRQRHCGFNRSSGNGKKPGYPFHEQGVHAG